MNAEGTRVVFGTEGGAVVVWDWVADGPRHTLTGHAGPVRAVSARGYRWVLSAGNDRTIRCRDATSGAPLHVLTGHTGSVTALTPPR